MTMNAAPFLKKTDIAPGTKPRMKPAGPYFCITYLAQSAVVLPLPGVSAYEMFFITSKGQIMNHPITEALPETQNWPNFD